MIKKTASYIIKHAKPKPVEKFRVKNEKAHTDFADYNVKAGLMDRSARLQAWREGKVVKRYKNGDVVVKFRNGVLWRVHDFDKWFEVVE